MKTIWRIDDVSLNTNMEELEKFTRQIIDPDQPWLIVVSPVVFKASGQRPFPRDMKPISDVTQFFRGSKIGMPDVPVWQGHMELAAHGMFHVDHRLLVEELQEYSILQSCAIVGTNTFVPPYNYFNNDTITVCRRHGIDLVRWGAQPWKHVLYNKFDPNHTHYYFHTFDLTPEQFGAWHENIPVDARTA